MRLMLSVILTVSVVSVEGFAGSPAPIVPVAQCDERYYMVLFGGQGDLFRPRTAHTWATFVRTSVSLAGEQVAAIDTISWLPATLDVRPFALKSETGVNLTLEETLAFMGNKPRRRVAVWGPYEITPERYAQAMRQKALLESGDIRYHSLGLLGRTADVMHCIDGVTRIDPVWERKANPSCWFGEGGTGQAARAAVRSGVILNPTFTHSWLLPAVNPSGHQLTERSLGKRLLVDFWPQSGR